MVRRCISVLVMAGYIAGQLASLPHAHGAVSAAEQRRHDSTPHFHVGGRDHANHDHHHGHVHAGHQEHHHHPDHQDHHHDHGFPSRPEELSDQQIHSGDTVNDHDADAIHLPATTGYAVIHSSAKTLSAADFAGAIASTVVALDRPLSAGWVLPEHPPDDCVDGSSLYLTLRQLRI